MNAFAPVQRSRPWRRIASWIAVGVVALWLVAPARVDLASTSDPNGDDCVAAGEAPDQPDAICKLDGRPQPYAAGGDSGGSVQKEACAPHQASPGTGAQLSIALALEPVRRIAALQFLRANGCADAGGARA